MSQNHPVQHHTGLELVPWVFESTHKLIFCFLVYQKKRLILDSNFITINDEEFPEYKIKNEKND